MSAIGGVVWAAGLTLLGYWLGNVALLDEHLDLVLVAIVAVSLIPVLVETLRSRSQTRDPRYDEESERLEVLRRAEEDR
jgi:membrane-associated protein